MKSNLQQVLQKIPIPGRERIPPESTGLSTMPADRPFLSQKR